MSTCSVGTGFTGVSASTGDNECEACPAGKFSDSSDLAPCQSHNTCGVSQGVATGGAGTASTDTKCEACPAGKFSGSSDLAACQPHTTCGVGQGVDATGTANADTVCKVCPVGFWSDAVDFTACKVCLLNISVYISVYIQSMFSVNISRSH